MNVEIFNEHFPKSWIDSISQIYYRQVEEATFIGTYDFFKHPGIYDKRYVQCDISLEDIEYFNGILYPINILILEHVIKNIEKFRNVNFIDHGAGFGLLSVFLSRLGIFCYNHDTFQQTREHNFHENVKKFANIQPVINHIPESCDGLIISGIYLDNTGYVTRNLKHLFIDNRNRIVDKYKAVEELTVSFALVETLGTQVDIYERIE